MTAPTPLAVVDGVDIDAVHNAVATCPGVAAVGGPGVAALTTYLPGRRIAGIRINPDSVDIEVVVDGQAPVSIVAAGIRTRLLPIIGGRRIDITIADIRLPDDQPPAVGSPPTR